MAILATLAVALYGLDRIPHTLEALLALYAALIVELVAFLGLLSIDLYKRYLLGGLPLFLRNILRSLNIWLIKRGIDNSWKEKNQDEIALNYIKSSIQKLISHDPEVKRIGLAEFRYNLEKLGDLENKKWAIGEILKISHLESDKIFKKMLFREACKSCMENEMI